MKNISITRKRILRSFLISVIFLLSGQQLLAQRGDTVYAEIAAIDQPFMLNRLGAAQPTGMVFALMSDLVQKDAGKPLTTPGNARLRADKRPRPIVLRANAGNVLKIKFTNLLAPYDSSGIFNAYGTNKPNTITQFNLAFSQGNLNVTRTAGLHIKGMEAATDISDDGSYNGDNPSSLANPGETRTYTLIVPEEGNFMLYSTGSNLDNNFRMPGGQLSNGLFGSINVQPEGAEWYRSQVSQADLDLAIRYYMQWSGDPARPNFRKIQKNSVPDIYKMTNTYPVINYDTVFSSGKPVLKMYIQKRPHYRELVYTDLTAIITGPKAGRFPESNKSPSFDKVWASPDRRQPYREFSIHYHEAPYAVQAFPIFYTNPLGATVNKGSTAAGANPTLQAGNDGFAINYGTGGIGAEVYANRIGVGPMAKCADCAYEEFFLSAWAVGDPAMVVDIPANATAANKDSVASSLQSQLLAFELQNPGDNGTMGKKFDPTTTIDPQEGYKATKALYPDDPSNVYHSYMSDHCKFRITHAGMGLAHVHHQHAHQWLQTPNSDDSHYLDSKTITPGSSFTLEMVHGGSGNLNKTVGDQIFHSHFYPHFASGMWSMWRVHDVLELGTKLDEDRSGRVAKGARALPDAEITRGTLIPGLVPLPTLAMAPVPAETAIEDGQVTVKDLSKNPGYPFFIPGLAGSRPPNPPMDFAQDAIYDSLGNKTGFGAQDGGLPRGLVLNANVAFENHTKYDWTKIIDSIQYIQLPDSGTVVEKIAMTAHSKRHNPTLKPDGTPGDFVLNGQPAVSGAPFADPRIDSNGDTVGKKRVYKAAVIQLDAVLNKKGWHFPQQRMESLWEDVRYNINGTKAPEPLYMRANSKDDYVELWHTNLVPEYYELDDYQVRTPTDVIGQHIHLVKFDVTSSDGAANGFNYEDGTLSPDVVRERIKAINKGGKLYVYSSRNYNSAKPINAPGQFYATKSKLLPKYPNPVWGHAPYGQDWRGAQTTIQRWYADPLYNFSGYDRTLTTVFTHDHFGPSTHQQVGLYAGLLIEPQGSTWKDDSNGDTLGKRNDGGPTSWHAVIVPKNASGSYREFMLEFQDNQLAYTAKSKAAPFLYPEFTPGITDPAVFKKNVDSNYRGWMDPSNVIQKAPSTPELITQGGRGTYSLNYRNEPIPMRVTNKGKQDVDSKSGDLSYAFASIPREDPAFNSQPVGGQRIDPYTNFRYPIDPIGPGMHPTDPYTPLLRAYENDSIQIRTLVGAHVTTHFFNVHGVNWLYEPTYFNSGYVSTQNMGLSEHFEMNFKLPSTSKKKGDSSFADYLYNASADMNGVVGGIWGLMRAYNISQGNLKKLPNNSFDGAPVPVKSCGCPNNAPVRVFHVTAININRYANTNHTDSLTYNEPYQYSDKTAMVYMLDSDLVHFRKDPNYSLEPLVLRARAGDCMRIILNDGTTSGPPMFKSSYSYVAGTNISLQASHVIGLHADLVSYDVRTSDGANVGFNREQTANNLGDSIVYEWYAGKWEAGKPVPVEFGSIPLSGADPLNHPSTGLIGALIIEPQGATWKEDPHSHWSASVYDSRSKLLFREFVLQFQDNISVASAHNYFANIKAINYRSEPLVNKIPTLYPNNVKLSYDMSDVSSFTSNISNRNRRQPVTPRMMAAPGQPVRIRLVNSGGSGTGEVFNLHGHVWQEEPHADKGTKLGFNKASNWFGFRDQLGALNGFDILITSAGGKNKVAGDYFYNSTTNNTFGGGVNLGTGSSAGGGGMWGIMTVKKNWIKVNKAVVDEANQKVTIWGSADMSTVTPTKISVHQGSNGRDVSAAINGGAWTLTIGYNSPDDVLEFKTNTGGDYSATLSAIAPALLHDKTKKLELQKLQLPEQTRGVKPEIQRVK